MMTRRVPLVLALMFASAALAARADLLDEQLVKIRAGEAVDAKEFRRAYDETVAEYRTAYAQYYLGQVKWSLVEPKRQGGWPFRSDLLMESPDTIYNGLKAAVAKTGDPVTRYAFVFPALYLHKDKEAEEQMVVLRQNDPFLSARILEVLPIARTMLDSLKQHGEELKARMAVKDSPATPSEAPVQPPEVKGILQVKRWPVQILSAVYGTAGKDADVTCKVKDYVETLQKPFASNPKALGADPNPGWNKSLRIVYMKDGVRREQRRNENEDILPESFYGPQDAAELKAWLPESRWAGEAGEIQFHADSTFTSPGQKEPLHWEALGPKKLRMAWLGGRTVEFQFDHTWSSVSEVDNGKNVFHVLR